MDINELTKDLLLKIVLTIDKEEYIEFNRYHYKGVTIDVVTSDTVITLTSKGKKCSYTVHPGYVIPFMMDNESLTCYGCIYNTECELIVKYYQTTDYEYEVLYSSENQLEKLKSPSS